MSVTTLGPTIGFTGITHFNVTSAEVDLVIDHVRQALLKGPRKQTAEAA